MQIIQPRDLFFIVRTNAQIVVDMRTQQHIAVLFQKILSVVVALLVPGIPAEAHRRTVTEKLEQRVQIFFALGVFKGQQHVCFFCRRHQLPEALNARRRGRMILKADKRMHDQQRDLFLYANIQAAQKLFKRFLSRLLIVFPHALHLRERRMQRLKDHPRLAGMGGAIVQDLLFTGIAHEKAVKPGSLEHIDLLDIRRAKGLAYVHAQQTSHCFSLAFCAISRSVFITGFSPRPK